MKILVADDEAIERGLLRRKIEKYFGDSLEVLEARNGREALALFSEHRPRILILDIEMPGITGLEAAKRIREEDRECSILFLTAYDEFSYAQQAITVRALDYLLKPCEDTELVSAVEEAVRIATREREETPAPEAAAVPEELEATGEKDASRSAEDASGLRAFIGDYIARHYMEDIAVQDIAGLVGYSDVYFCKLFTQYFGQSFVSFLTDYRIGIAKERLLESGANVKQVGRSVGYADSNYFAKVFRRVVGESPTDYRNRAGN